jgi:hypothetical protein
MLFLFPLWSHPTLLHFFSVSRKYSHDVVCSHDLIIWAELTISYLPSERYTASIKPVVEIPIICPGYLEDLVHDTEKICQRIEATFSRSASTTLGDKLPGFVLRIRATVTAWKNFDADFNIYEELLSHTQDLDLDQRTRRQLYLKLRTLEQMLLDNAKTNLSTSGSLRRDFLILKKELSKSLAVEGGSLYDCNTSPF